MYRDGGVSEVINTDNLWVSLIEKIDRNATVSVAPSVGGFTCHKCEVWGSWGTCRHAAHHGSDDSDGVGHK